MIRASQQTRTWSGVSVVVGKIDTTSGVLMASLSTHAKIQMALRTRGGRFDMRLAWDQPTKTHRPNSILHVVPRDVTTWCVDRRLRKLDHLTLLLDPGAMPDDLRTRVELLPTEPRLGLSSSTVVALGRLLAYEVERSDPPDNLHADCLIAAILTETLRVVARSTTQARAHRLTSSQLSRVTDFMQANLSSGVELHKLARLTGLSQSHFCNAFKLTTGKPPYQYYTTLRIERAQHLLSSNADASLHDIAQALGFADQSHFTRTFRKVVGVTPRAWLPRVRLND